MGSLGKIQLHIRKSGGQKDDGNIATQVGEAASSGWGLLASAAALPHKFCGSNWGLTCFASSVMVSFICTRFLSLTLQFCSSITKGAPPLVSKEQNYPIGNSNISLFLCNVLLQLPQLVCHKKWSRFKTTAQGASRFPGLMGHFHAKGKEAPALW